MVWLSTRGRPVPLLAVASHCNSRVSSRHGSLSTKCLLQIAGNGYLNNAGQNVTGDNC